MKKRNTHIRYIVAGVLGIVAIGALATGLTRCFSLLGSVTVGQLVNTDNSRQDSIKPITADAWADSIMRQMSPREKIAQLFFPRWEVSGSAATPSSTTKLQVVKEGVGGFLLGKGSSAEYASVINRVQSEAKIPLLVTLDGEWGPNMRVTDAPRFPKNIALGAIQNPELIERYGREVARECRELGIQVDFAPVLDVNSNPNNPVIGYRSFGEDPQRVAVLGAAFCKGMESGGVMSVGKHFPGHGDTSVDSHKALPTVNHDVKTLEAVDYVPFIAAKEAGMSGIMVGHLNVPALDKSGTPASLSEKITTGILRNKLGFNGLIFTDALAMKGADLGSENNAVSAFIAGADVLLQPRSLSKDIDAMMKAVESGRISQDEVDRRCRKLLIYKYNLGLSGSVKVNAAGLAGRLNSHEAKSLLDELAKASITVVENKNDILPLADIENKTIAVVSIGAKARNEFSSTCSEYCPTRNVSVITAADTRYAVAEASKVDEVIIAVYKNDAMAREAYSELLKTNPNAVGVFFVNPFKLSTFTQIKSTPAVVMAYEDTKELQSAAAQAVFGGIDVTGRFPVNINGVAELGAGVNLKKKRLAYAEPGEAGLSGIMTDNVSSVLTGAVKGGAVPGCQVLVAKDGMIVYNKSFGTFNSGGKGGKVDEHAIYDLASMSKVCGTLAALMKSYDMGLWSLDDEIGKFIPEIEDRELGSVTMRQLLYHQSGLPATLNIYRAVLDTATYNNTPLKYKYGEPYTIKVQDGVYGDKNARLRKDIYSTEKNDKFHIPVADGIFATDSARTMIMNLIYEMEPQENKRFVYSDLNFCLLMQINENITGVPQDQFLEEHVYDLLGMWNTGYRPLEFHDIEKIAPTEVDTYLRKQHLRGYVHDEIAAFSGGLQGNAGLFSNVNDLVKLFQTWLNGGEYGGVRVFEPETVALFTGMKSPTCDRLLGFDMLTTKTDWGVSPRTYGHTGFTGTCFWIDPDSQLIYIFLSNRVNPSRSNGAFTRLNPRYNALKAVYDAL